MLKERFKGVSPTVKYHFSQAIVFKACELYIGPEKIDIEFTNDGDDNYSAVNEKVFLKVLNAFRKSREAYLVFETEQSYVNGLSSGAGSVRLPTDVSYTWGDDETKHGITFTFLGSSYNISDK